MPKLNRTQVWPTWTNNVFLLGASDGPVLVGIIKDSAPERMLTECCGEDVCVCRERAEAYAALAPRETRDLPSGGFQGHL